MELDRLDILAELFWEGACTDSEEQELKELIQDGPVPTRHGELKAYLDFTEHAVSAENLGGSFDQQIMREIERRESNHNSYPMWMKIAAGIVILLGLFSLVRSFTGSTDPQAEQPQIVMLEDDTFEDPELAYEEVKKALALMGMKMNDGMDHAGSLGMFDQAKEEISSDKVQKVKKNRKPISGN
jgi:hypothetical protein